jgi:tetratricopeptide (TPR) repeat protein
MLMCQRSHLHSIKISITKVSDDVGNFSIAISDLREDITTKLDVLPDLASTINNLNAKVPGTLDSIEKKLDELRMSSTPVPVITNIYEVPNQGVQRFVGRETILDKIKEAASTRSETAPQKVVLRAMGGQGKTQVALKFCSRMRGQRDIFWVDASSEANVRSTFASFAPLLQPSTPTDLNADACIDMARRYLTSWSKPWLIVFDNYDDPAAFNIDAYIPENEQGFVIVTTRHAAVDQLADQEYQIALPSLPENEAVELLLKEGQFKTAAQETATESAKRIVERLGYHALAIAQAASYIRTKKLRIEDFLDIFEQEKAKILEQWKHQMSRYRKKIGASEAETSIGVFTTWELSYQQLEREDVGNYFYSDLLTLMAFFNSNDVSEELFKAFCSSEETVASETEHFRKIIEKDEEPDHEEGDDLDGIEELYNFFEISSNEEPGEMGTTRSGTCPECQEQEFAQPETKDCLLGIDDSINPRVLYTKALLHQYAKESDHLSNIYPGAFLQRLIGQWDQSVFLDALSILEQLSLIQDFSLKEDGFYHSSLHPLVRDWIRIRTAGIIGRCKKYSSLAATCLYILLLYVPIDGMGKLDLLQRTRLISHLLTISDNQQEWYPDEPMLPHHKPQAGKPETFFGHLLYSNEDYVQAERCIKEAYKHALRLFGQKSIETLRAANLVALVMARNGEYSEIKKMLVPVLMAQRKGRNCTPETLESFASLAQSLSCQGNHTDAESALREVLRLSRSLPGCKRVNKIEYIVNLAACLKLQWKNDEALELFEEAIRLRKEMEAKDGQRHQHLLNFTTVNMATLLGRLGRIEEAEGMIRQTLEMERPYRSNGVPSVLWMKSELASVLLQNGRAQESEKLHREVLESRMLALGESHNDTLVSMTDLAVVQAHLGKFVEAEKLFTQSIRLMTVQWGDEHPLALSVVGEYANMLQHLGRYDEASAFYLKLINGAERCFGSEHTNTLAAKSQYAVVLAKSGQLEEAELLQRAVADVATMVLKPTDPYLLVYHKNYQITLNSLNRYDDSLEVTKELIRLLKLSNHDNSEILEYQSFQAYILGWMGRRQEALEVAEAVVGTAKNVLSANDPVLYTCQYTYALALEFSSRHEEAEEFYKKAIKGLEQGRPADGNNLRLFREGQERNLKKIGQSGMPDKEVTTTSAEERNLLGLVESLTGTSEDDDWVDEDEDDDWTDEVECENE